MATNLSASLEDYIETIYHLVEEGAAARVKDIAERLNVRNASVTGALHALADKKLVNYAPYDVTTLTPRGVKVAEDVVHRHRTLRDFLEKVLGVATAEADAAACRMEHAVPAHVLERLADFVGFVEDCPRAGAEWAERFKALDGGRIDPSQCAECVNGFCRKFKTEEKQA